MSGNSYYGQLMEKIQAGSSEFINGRDTILREEAQSAPTPITNYALFHDGEYVTNEQMNDKKFLKLVGSM